MVIAFYFLFLSFCFLTRYTRFFLFIDKQFTKKWKIIENKKKESLFQRAADILFTGLSFQCKNYSMIKASGITVESVHNNSIELFGSTQPDECIIFTTNDGNEIAAPFVMEVKPCDIDQGFTEVVSTTLFLHPVSNWHQVLMSFSQRMLLIVHVNTRRIESVKYFDLNTTTAENIYDYFDLLLGLMFPKDLTCLDATSHSNGFRVQYLVSSNGNIPIVLKRHAIQNNKNLLTTYVEDLYDGFGVKPHVHHIPGETSEITKVITQTKAINQVTDSDSAFFVSTVASDKAKKQSVTASKSAMTLVEAVSQDSAKEMSLYTVPKFDGIVVEEARSLEPFLAPLLAALYCMNCSHNDVRLPNIVLAKDSNDNLITPNADDFRNGGTFPLALIDFEYATNFSHDHLKAVKGLKTYENFCRNYSRHEVKSPYFDMCCALMAANRTYNVTVDESGVKILENGPLTESTNDWIESLKHVLGYPVDCSVFQEVYPGKLFSLYFYNPISNQ